MSDILNILKKVVVVRFYERNAGLFLFLFFLMFGIVESSQLLSYHLSLITGMIHSPVFLAVVAGIWTMYMIKCLQFALGSLSIPENEFLYRIGLTDRSQQFVAVFFAFTLIYLPVLSYSAVVVGISVIEGKFATALLIVGFHAALLAAATALVVRKINSPHIYLRILNLPVIHWKGPRPFPLFYIGHLTDQLKTVLWVTKAFSFFAIIGFLQLAENYDVRIPLLGLLLGLAAHAVIVFEFRRFEDQYLTFSRNLPISLFRRFVMIVIVYLIVLVPEIILLLVNRIRLPDLAGMGLFGAMFLTLIHCLQYSSELNIERQNHKVLFLFLISFMLVLSHAWGAELAVIAVVAIAVFQRKFDSFEGQKG